jgi:hypothetical protein
MTASHGSVIDGALALCIRQEEDRIEELDYQRMEAAYRIELGLASAYAL